MTDQTAVQDRWGRPRPGRLSHLIQTATRPSDPALGTRRSGRVASVNIMRPASFVSGSLPANVDAIVAATKAAMGGDPSIQVEGPAFVGTEFIRQSHRVLVQMVDYSRGKMPCSIRLRPADRLGRLRSVRFLAPRSPASELQILHEAGASVIEVPPLDLYGVVVLDLE